MQFPYGLSDFGTLIRSGYWYQDRTDRLALIEDAGRQLIFLRPRRFGKSLLLSMLEHYYDLNRADEFSALFGTLAVGRAPTALHNRYFVMKWDFSLVKSHVDLREIEYLPLGELGLTGAEVRARSRESLAALPSVVAQLDAAADQARDYGATLANRHGLTGLNAFAVVALGVERLIWRAL